MAEITAQVVNEFRKKTGLGLMECKKLLTEAGGDLAKAETLAKERGLKQAELRAGRAAKAGEAGEHEDQAAALAGHHRAGHGWRSHFRARGSMASSRRRARPMRSQASTAKPPPISTVRP